MSAESFPYAFLFVLEHKKKKNLYQDVQESMGCRKCTLWGATQKLLSAPHFSSFFSFQTRTYTWAFEMKEKKRKILTIHDQNRNVYFCSRSLVSALRLYATFFFILKVVINRIKMDMVLLIFAVCLFSVIFLFSIIPLVDDEENGGGYGKMDKKML